MNLSFKGIQPVIDPSVYVAPGAMIIGDVVIGPESSIWFGALVRADVHYIRIGAQTNIQDQCMLHVTGGAHPRTLAMGVPAEPRREITQKELARARDSASHYIELSVTYRKEHTPPR